MTPSEFAKLQEKVENLKQKKDKAAGALSQILKEIKEKYGCKTIAEAETKLNQLKRKQKQAQTKYDKLLKRFEREWADKLEDL